MGRNPRSDDPIQRALQAQMGGPNRCDAWTSKMTRELAQRQSTANFSAYLAQGEAPTIRRSPQGYNQRSGGMPYADWLAALLLAEQLLAELLNGPLPTDQTRAICLEPPKSCALSQGEANCVVIPLA